MKTWQKALLGVTGALAALVGALAIVVAARPDHTTVRRSRTFAASPEQVSAYLTDLHRWLEWNPWDRMEPTSHKEFSDPASGVGAWYTWRGEEVGTGRMEITAITPTSVTYDLHFMEPFESDSVVRMELTPRDGGTELTWIMDSDANFMSKAFGLFMDMDAMIGADFERGLGFLAERLSQPPGHP